MSSVKRSEVNPFPSNDGAIESRLHVGRRELIGELLSSLNEEPSGRVRVWAVEAERGTGKSSLARLFDELGQEMLRDQFHDTNKVLGVAVHEWVREQSLSYLIANLQYELHCNLCENARYSQNVEGRISQPLANLIRASLYVGRAACNVAKISYFVEFKPDRVLSNVGSFFKWLKGYPDPTSFLIVIDEASRGCESTFRFAHALSDSSESKLGASPNVDLVLLFKPPWNFEDGSSTPVDVGDIGPRALQHRGLKDFSVGECDEFINRALAAESWQRSDGVADAVHRATGGVPTLLSGVLYEAANEVLRRADQVVPKLGRGDVSKVVQFPGLMIRGRMESYRLRGSFLVSESTDWPHYADSLQVHARKSGDHCLDLKTVDQWIRVIEAHAGHIRDRSNVKRFIEELGSSGIMRVEDGGMRWRGTLLAMHIAEILYPGRG